METVDQRAYVYVGMPHAGTAYLHRSLLRNRKGLGEDGVSYPGNRDRMFLAAVDVCDSHEDWGLEREDVRGSWDDLCRRAREHHGTTIIGHELLAGAPARRVVAAMSMLKGLEVHLVLTVADPARQVAQAWQEQVRHGSGLTFDAFRRELLDARNPMPQGRRWRAAHDLPDVLARWGIGISRERVHVVTVPPAEPRALWERFGEAVGIDTGRFRAVGQEAAERTLGTDETDLLRRVNVALDSRVDGPDYGPVVRDVYARTLADTVRSPAPVAPAHLYDDLRVVGERWAKEIDKAGHPVYGDLAELVPDAPAGPLPHPDEVEPAAQVEAATWATAELLVELGRRRTELTRLEAALDKQRRKRKKLKRQLAAATPEDD